MAFEARGGQPPAEFGATPPGSATRKGRIDEDARRPAPPVGKHRRFLPGVEQARLDAGRTGAFGAWRQLLEPRAVGVAGEDVGVVSGERRDGERLAAATRPDIDDGVPLLRPQGRRPILAPRCPTLPRAPWLAGTLDR